MWVAVVHCWNSSADHAYHWLSSLWVAVVPFCNSSLLITPVLGSPVGEWLWCIAAILASWTSLSSRMWVAVVPCHNSSLLIIPVLGSPESEWLWCLAAILAFWSCLSLALQNVSSCGALLQFWPADHSCPWLSSGWVAVVSCYNSSLLTISVLGSLESELWCLATILACWSSLSLTL